LFKNCYVYNSTSWRSGQAGSGSGFLQISTDEYDVNDDFATTLRKLKKKEQSQGVYAILPKDKIDLEHEFERIDRQLQQRLIRNEKKKQ
jgi:hypothetical protein